MAAPADDRPIVSLLLEDASLLPRIDSFVLGLSEVVDGLQDQERTGSLRRVAEECERLQRDAELHGFPPLAEAARGVGEAARSGEPRKTHELLVTLTDVARRVRMGHRGAAPPGL